MAEVFFFFSIVNMHVQIETRVETVDSNHSVTVSTQTINRCSNQKLPDSVVKLVSTARHRQSMCQAKRSGYRLF